MTTQHELIALDDEGNVKAKPHRKKRAAPEPSVFPVPASLFESRWPTNRRGVRPGDEELAAELDRLGWVRNVTLEQIGGGSLLVAERKGDPEMVIRHGSPEGLCAIAARQNQFEAEQKKEASPPTRRKSIRCARRDKRTSKPHARLPGLCEPCGEAREEEQRVIARELVTSDDPVVREHVRPAEPTTPTEKPRKAKVEVPKPPPADTPHWFTPLDWFLRTEERLLEEKLIPRPFDLDPFGHPAAPVSLEIARRPGGKVAVGLELGRVDGMAQSWADGVVWVNTGPYKAKHLEQVAEKMLAEAIGIAGMAWLGPNWRDRKWFHEYFAPGISDGTIIARDVEGRLPFGWPEYPNGHKRRPAQFPSLLLVWMSMELPEIATATVGCVCSHAAHPSGRCTWKSGPPEYVTPVECGCREFTPYPVNAPAGPGAFVTSAKP